MSHGEWQMANPSSLDFHYMPCLPMPVANNPEILCVAKITLRKNSQNGWLYASIHFFRQYTLQLADHPHHLFTKIYPRLAKRGEY